MKKGIIVLFIALLGVSFTATSALAGSSHGHGYKRTGITVAGCGSSGYFQVHAGFSGPPVFFPFPPPFFHGTVVKNRCSYRNGHHGDHRSYRHKRCRNGHHGDYRSYRHKNYRHENQRRHGNDRHRDNNSNGKRNRSDGHGKRL